MLLQRERERERERDPISEREEGNTHVRIKDLTT
jgi:hypothetical protein